jgi:hypothetical protein
MPRRKSTIQGSQLSLLPVSRAEAIAELRRELAMREVCYPKWVADGSLSQAKADTQVNRLNAAIEFLLEEYGED